MSTVDITFPGNIPQVASAAALRAVPSSYIASDALYVVIALGEIFRWDPSSSAVDDGDAVIKPNDIGGNSGRWLVALGASSAGNAAAAEAAAAAASASATNAENSENSAAGSATSAGTSAASAATSAAGSVTAATQANADAIQTAADRTQTGLDRAATTSIAGSITTAGAISNAFPNTATSNVPRGLTQASVGAITAGSGGTNGTFALGWSGGNFTANPTGTFTVAGGALTAVTITGPGQYIGASPTVPTPVFTASAGLTGAAVVLTAQFLPSSGSGYYAQSGDGLSLLPYLNSSGTATAVSGVGSIDTSTGIDSKFTARGVSTLSPFTTWPYASNPGGSIPAGQYISQAIAGPTAFNRIPGMMVDNGTGQILFGQYDSRILMAVQAGESAFYGPYATLSSGNIVLNYGGATTTIRSTGTAQDLRNGSGGYIASFTDLVKGRRVPLLINTTGATLAIQRNAAFDVYTGAGSSAMGGAFASPTADTVPIYPGRTLSLTGGPVLIDAVTRSGTASLIDLYETPGGFGTMASYFTASMYKKTKVYRPGVRMGFVGHGVNGSAIVSSIDQTSPGGQDILASLARFMVVVGATTTNGLVRSIAHFVHHGDNVSGNTYVTTLPGYQSGWETAVQAVTGQLEPVYFFCSQCATNQRFAFLSSTTPSIYTGNQAMLEFTRNVADGGNAKAFPTVADYILVFGDNQHPAAGMTGVDLKAEYEAKAADIVLNQGKDFVAARVRPPSYWTLGTGYIDIPCEVQVAPLLIDTSLCTDPGADSGAVDVNGKGFTLTDSNSCRITSVAIRPDGTTIRVSYSGTLGTGRILDYAYSNGLSNKSGNGTTDAGPRGLVHDSDTTLSRDGTKTLYNPLWAFRYSF